VGRLQACDTREHLSRPGWEWPDVAVGGRRGRATGLAKFKEGEMVVPLGKRECG
jgi:hypothetical protein